jgi:hypothetical protein
MTVFTFVIILVLISTVGKIFADRQGSRQLPPADYRPVEVGQLQESVNDLGARLEKIEEERDFYRSLLEAPPVEGRLPPGPSTPSEPGPTDSTG